MPACLAEFIPQTALLLRGTQKLFGGTIYCVSILVFTNFYYSLIPSRGGQARELENA